MGEINSGNQLVITHSPNNLHNDPSGKLNQTFATSNAFPSDHTAAFNTKKLKQNNQQLKQNKFTYFIHLFIYSITLWLTPAKEKKYRLLVWSVAFAPFWGILSGMHA